MCIRSDYVCAYGSPKWHERVIVDGQTRFFEMYTKTAWRIEHREFSNIFGRLRLNVKTNVSIFFSNRTNSGRVASL